MTDDIEILQARSAGEARYAMLRDYSGNWDRVLSRLGFSATSDALHECARDKALSILTRLLWKDMAYAQPCMAESEAMTLAGQFINRYSSESSRYYSNGDWDTSGSWTPFTAATFDGGIIIQGPDSRFICIWFEDED